MTNRSEDQINRQRTLAAPIRVYGKGIHTGQPVSMTVYPGEPDSGVCFLRSDQPPSRALILARWSNVVSAQYSTDLGNSAGVRVRTVEHLMAALRIAGVDNVLVVLNGPEVPALDGSAAPFLEQIQHAGTIEQDAPARAIVLLHSVQVRDGDRYARLTPSVDPRLTVTIDFPGTLLGMQSVGLAWKRDLLAREIAPARTFGFAEKHHALKALGYALGADVSNTVVVDGKRVCNPGGLRYTDEFVRHKALDAIGDLYLAGWPIRANYDGYKPGHGLNVALLRKALGRGSEAWALVPSRSAKRTGSMALATAVAA